MSSPADSDFRLRSIAVAGFGPSVLFGFSQGAILPVVAISAIDRGATEAVASLVVAIMGLGSLLTNIPAGVITTRIGERRSMVGAAGLSAVGLILCLLNADLLVFALGILLIGAASSVFLLARQSYMTEMVPESMRARALSTLGGAQRIGVFVGPFIGAAALGTIGLSGAYLIGLVAILAAGAIAYTVPDLSEEETEAGRAAAAGGPAPARATTLGMLKTHWRTFAMLGTGILLLSAIRSTRQVVVPLWATHIGLDAGQTSIVYGIAGVVDAAIFYPAGYVMDKYGRKWIAIPCTIIMGISFLLMPLTHAAVTLTLVSVLMGFGNGIGSGIVNTLGSDASPAVGRPTFLGLWRELADGGSAIGPLILSIVTGFAGLAVGIVVSGFVGFAAAATLAKWIPRRPRPDAPPTD
ncbi:MFS transporter [Frondihabitans cladoniiphilus]|uniref:MFS transporter n=1 Tax=Frondihabitans cladoniiphilus TaxID=715785 RepID=A0ABP8W446_9MICO